MDIPAPYYSRGVFIDAGPWVLTRLWKGEQLERDFATLRARPTLDHMPWLPADAADAAARWGSTVAVVEVNPK